MTLWRCDCCSLWFTLKLKTLIKNVNSGKAEGGALTTPGLKENWNENMFQGLMSNIFTASHTILSLLINKILSDQSHSLCLSADQSECILSRPIRTILSAVLGRRWMWQEAGFLFTQVLYVVQSGEEKGPCWCCQPINCCFTGSDVTGNYISANATFGAVN